MNIMHIKQLIHCYWLVPVLFISACSSHIPAEISKVPVGAPGVAQAHKQIDAYISQKVRWGGVILSNENKQKTSRLTIIAFPLSQCGEPQISDESPGRFIAIIDEFLEPLVYNSDREITVIGKLLRSETLTIGEFAYEYPVIQVENFYLWPSRSDPSDINFPHYWYDPWYRPYYPRYPYYPRGFRR